MVCKKNLDMIFVVDLKTIMLPESYERLMTVLKEEFPESTYTMLFDKSMRGHQVIIFEDAADHLSFKLKYGHLYHGEPHK